MITQDESPKVPPSLENCPIGGCSMVYTPKLGWFDYLKGDLTHPRDLEKLLKSRERCPRHQKRSNEMVAG